MTIPDDLSVGESKSIAVRGRQERVERNDRQFNHLKSIDNDLRNGGPNDRTEFGN